MNTTPTISARDLPALLDAPKDAGRANRGRGLEEFLTALFDVYRARGVACIAKVPTAWLPIRDGGGKIVSAKVENPAVVDFLGVAHGRPVAIEAKSAADRIRWDAVTDVQASFLDDHERASGLGFVAVDLGGDRYLIPWREWRRMAASTGFAGYDAVLRIASGDRKSISRRRARVEWAIYALDTRDAFAALRNEPASQREGGLRR